MGWEERQGSAAALFIAMIILPTVATCLRIWGLSVMRERRPGWDDYTAFAALPFVVAENSLFIWWLKVGLGINAAELPTQSLVKTHLISFIGDCLYTLGVALPKFSALFFYNRIFEKTSRTFHIVLWLLGALNLAWIIMMILLTAFQCSPIRAAWDSTIKNKKCLPEFTLFMGRAVVSVLIDVLILLAPLPYVWRLRLPTSRKFFLVLVFIAGYSVIICSVGRIIALAKLGNGLYTDPTYGLTPYATWVASEGSVSVVCVSIPLIYHFFKQIYHNGWQFAFTGARRDQSRNSRNNAEDKKRRRWFSRPNQTIATATLHADARMFGSSGTTSAEASAASSTVNQSHSSMSDDVENKQAALDLSDSRHVQIKTDVYVFQG